MTMATPGQPASDSPSGKAQKKPVLIFLGSPSKDTGLKVEEELLDVYRCLSGAFEVVPILTGKVTDLEVQLKSLAGRLVVLHISTHGTVDSLKIVIDAWQKREAKKSDLLGWMDRVAGLFLSACFSGAVLKGIPKDNLGYVVGVNGEVYDSDARAFARAFYGCLVNDAVRLRAALGELENLLAGNGENPKFTIERPNPSVLNDLGKSILPARAWWGLPFVKSEPVGPLANLTFDSVVFGDVNFSSDDVLLIREGPNSNKEVPSRKVHFNGSYWPFVLSTVRSVRVLGDVPVSAESRLSVHQVNPLVAIASVLLLASCLGLLVCLLCLSGGALPGTEVWTAGALPALFPAATALLAFLGMAEPLRKWVSSRPGKGILLLSLALLLPSLVARWRGWQVRNESGEPIAVGARSVEDGELALLSKTWDGGARYIVSPRADAGKGGVPSIRCRETYADYDGSVSLPGVSPHVTYRSEPKDAGSCLEGARMAADAEMAKWTREILIEGDHEELSFDVKGPPSSPLEKVTVTIRAGRDSKFVVPPETMTRLRRAADGGDEGWVLPADCSTVRFEKLNGPEVAQRGAGRTFRPKPGPDGLTLLCSLKQEGWAVEQLELSAASVDAGLFTVLPSEVVPRTVVVTFKDPSFTTELHCPSSADAGTAVGSVGPKCKYEDQVDGPRGTKLACWVQPPGDAGPCPTKTTPKVTCGCDSKKRRPCRPEFGEREVGKRECGVNQYNNPDGCTRFCVGPE